MLAGAALLTPATSAEAELSLFPLRPTYVARMLLFLANVIEQLIVALEHVRLRHTNGLPF